jgi:hypothetical protein
MAQDNIPQGGHLSYVAGLSGDLVMQTPDLTVTLTPPGDASNGQVTITPADGRGPVTVEWPDSEPLTPDALFLPDSFVCDRPVIDLVIRIAPAKYGDIPSFSYDRMMFDADKLALLAHARDPSVLMANAVLPLQSVSGDDTPWPAFDVTCGTDGSIGLAVRE